MVGLQALSLVWVQPFVPEAPVAAQAICPPFIAQR